MSGLDLLGADTPATSTAAPSLARGAVAVAAGLLGAALVPKHRVLAFLDAAAVAANAHAVATGERSVKEAVRRVGRHVVATAGSLALPAYPVIGYVAGAIAGDLIIDGEGGGIVEEWNLYEGAGARDKKKKKEDVIDAEVVEPSKALVKT